LTVRKTNHGATQRARSRLTAHLLSTSTIALLLAVSPLLPRVAWTQSAYCDQDEDSDCPTPLSRLLAPVEAYATAPLRWREADWLWFGGSLAAIGIAHQFDGDVRKHFAGNVKGSLSTSNSHDLQDALPAAVLFVGTWGYANLIDDRWGRREAGTMFESAALSVGTAYILKYAAGRQRPDQTVDPNRWEAGGSSFPSLHATAAFAIGTVLAESGNDQYRWIRRALGYGAAGFTAYERLNHNAHWLSDTVAGAALGTASARFAMNRATGAKQTATMTVSPLYHGLMFSFVAHLP
jgi:membrane-associated phospholipid phosphatase